MSTITLKTTEVQHRWPDILANLSPREHDEVVITDGQEIKAVLMNPVYYRYLMQLVKRELQRQGTMALPLTAKKSMATWNAGFEILEHLSEKFTGVSDEEMDDLFGEVLAEVRKA